MRALTTFIPLICLLGTVSATQLSAQSPTDQDTGLVQTTGWQEVKANCTECHSAQMIIQNSGNRAVWKSRIVWMQQTQGLGELSSETEDAILTYLAANYGQKEASRRGPLPSHLMPLNPLESSN